MSEIIDFNLHRGKRALKRALWDTYHEDLEDEIDQYSVDSLFRVENSGYTVKDIISDVAENMDAYAYNPDTDTVLWSDDTYQDMLDSLLSAHSELTEVLQ